MRLGIQERWAADKGFGTPAPVEEALWEPLEDPGPEPVEEAVQPGVEWKEWQHPRDAFGRFIDVVGGLDKGDSTYLSGGPYKRGSVYVRRELFDTYTVIQGEKQITGFTDPGDATRAAADISAQQKVEHSLGGTDSFGDYDAFLKAQGLDPNAPAPAIPTGLEDRANAAEGTARQPFLGRRLANYQRKTGTAPTETLQPDRTAYIRGTDRFQKERGKNNYTAQTWDGESWYGEETHDEITGTGVLSKLRPDAGKGVPETSSTDAYDVEAYIEQHVAPENRKFGMIIEMGTDKFGSYAVRLDEDGVPRRYRQTDLMEGTRFRVQRMGATMDPELSDEPVYGQIGVDYYPNREAATRALQEHNKAWVAQAKPGDEVTVQAYQTIHLPVMPGDTFVRPDTRGKTYGQEREEWKVLAIDRPNARMLLDHPRYGTRKEGPQWVPIEADAYASSGVPAGVDTMVLGEGRTARVSSTVKPKFPPNASPAERTAIKRIAELQTGESNVEVSPGDDATAERVRSEAVVTNPDKLVAIGKAAREVPEIDALLFGKTVEQKERIDKARENERKDQARLIEVQQKMREISSTGPTYALADNAEYQKLNRQRIAIQQRLGDYPLLMLGVGRSREDRSAEMAAALRRLSPDYGEGKFRRGYPDDKEGDFASTYTPDERLSARAAVLPAAWVDFGAPIWNKDHDKSRANYDDSAGANGTINARPDESDETLQHELGHYVEHHLASVLQAEAALKEQRSAHERPVKMSSLEKWGGYDPWEYTRPDKWAKPYTGKDYGSSAYEIVSTGLQRVFYPGGWWSPSPTDDPDHVNWMIGLLLTAR